MPPALKKFLPWTAAVASGALTAIAYPPVEMPDAIWFAFVPLLIALRGAGAKRGFQLGFVAGAVAWLASIYWISHVTTFGMILLSLYCALYTGFFGALVAAWFRRFGVSFLANLALMLAAPLAWAGLEYVRCTFATGFPWNPLGVALYRNVALIQLASFGGAYLVSAVIILMNTGLACALVGYFTRKKEPGFPFILGWARRAPELLVALLAVVLCYVTGFRIFRSIPDGDRTIRVALIQPNIPQDEKWDEEKIQFIYARLHEQTTLAQYAGKFDLIVWPETALPDDLRYSEPSYNLVRSLVTNGSPILVGSMDTIHEDSGRQIYFNCSMLVDTHGRLIAQYDKRHLVPFGEYVPLQKYLPFIQAFTPIQASFTGGSTSTVFQLETANGLARFSVLICFEDTIARLARESVRNGARLIINQTNDAWFDPSAASRQHMAQCVLRCVENRVPALRSANTGVSCHIDSRGRILPNRDVATSTVRTTGFYSHDVRPAPDNHPLTFYTRHGDVFALTALALAALLAGYFFLTRRALAA